MSSESICPVNDFDADGPADPSQIFGLPQGYADARTIVLPVPFDATASYRRGAVAGPLGIFAASHQVDLYHLTLGPVWRHGIFSKPLDSSPVPSWNREATAAVDRFRSTKAADALVAANRIGKQLTRWVNEQTSEILSDGKIPAIVGGDHSVALGAIQAVLASRPETAVLQVDAHLDLRPAYEGFVYSHASVMHNVLDGNPRPSNLTQVGIRDVGQDEWKTALARNEVSVWTDRDMGRLRASGQPWQAIVDAIIEPLPETIWLSIDVDGLCPSLCPNTGTPVPGGLGWNDFLILVERVHATGRIIAGFDLCEVGAGEWDCIVGARLLYELAAVAACSRFGLPEGPLEDRP